MVVGDSPALRANCRMLISAWSRASRSVVMPAFLLSRPGEQWSNYLCITLYHKLRIEGGIGRDKLFYAMAITTYGSLMFRLCASNCGVGRRRALVRNRVSRDI